MRRIALPAYLMGLLLVAFPLIDTTVSVWPVRAGEMAWRFGAVGLLSRALMTPLLGMLLALVVALLLEHWRVVRFIAAISGLGGLSVLVLVTLFAMDAVQMRSQVKPASRLAFDIASGVALLKYACGFVVLVAIAVSGRKASRIASHSQPPREPILDPARITAAINSTATSGGATSS